MVNNFIYFWSPSATYEPHTTTPYTRLKNHATLQSTGLGSLRRILLSLPLHLRSASAALALGDRVHHRGNVVSAPPPGDLVCATLLAAGP